MKQLAEEDKNTKNLAIIYSSKVVKKTNILVWSYSNKNVKTFVTEFGLISNRICFLCIMMYSILH